MLTFFRLTTHLPHHAYLIPYPPTLGYCIWNVTERPAMAGGIAQIAVSVSSNIAYRWKLCSAVASPKMLPYYLQTATFLPAWNMPDVYFRNVRRFDLNVNTTCDQYVYAVKSRRVQCCQLLTPEFPSIRLWFRYDTFQHTPQWLYRGRDMACPNLSRFQVSFGTNFSFSRRKTIE